MSEEEGFLTRWSRRKRTAAPDAREQLRPKSADGGAQSEGSAVAPPAETQLPFDPASLPPIDSIGVGSDIQAFLAAGVPADLTRAALRRAWSTDLAIRDFIGLSENSWDFNTPGGVPGFGSMTSDDIRQFLAEVNAQSQAAASVPTAAETLSVEQAATPGGESGPAAALARPALRARDPARNQSSQEHDTSLHCDPQGSDEVNIAVHHGPAGNEYCAPLPRRGHGGALPE
jgi:uncharacterized protein DUF3306